MTPPGHRFEVWAPAASTVEVVLGAGRHPLAPEGRRPGWHSGEVAGAGPGTRYAFSLDGGPPRPDPRSPSQPDGVQGSSEVVDHDAFGWTDGGWRAGPLASAVVYELHVGTFTTAGTFAAAAERFDHLVELGVTAVELMPVNEFPGRRGWGYDGVGLFAAHHGYGGPEGLKGLVDSAHRAGLAVILDVVYNHLGPSGNHLAEFGPYFTSTYATPWGPAVNLDGADSDEVRRFFLDNAAMWLRDYHFDGLRIDAVHSMFDRSATHLLEAMAVEVEALAGHLGRGLWLIAESDLNDPRLVERREVGGYGLDAQWSDDFHHALHSVLTGEVAGYYADFGSLSHLAAALRQPFVLAGQHSGFRRRVHGRAPAGLPGWRFLGYAQNHDQVGNRALGERSAALMSPGRLRTAAALVMTSPYVPMLFMGEEWGAGTPFQYFTDHPDPELGRAVTAGRREEFAAFGWPADAVPDPQDPATFERSRLDWDELARPDHAAILDWHRQLISLRRRLTELTDGRMREVAVDFDEAAGRLLVRRGRVSVAANLGSGPWPQDPGWPVLLAWPALPGSGVDGFDLAPDGVAVRVDPGPAPPR